MAGANGSEVSVVEGQDMLSTEALSQGDYRGVRAAEREVRVLASKLGDPLPFGPLRSQDFHIGHFPEEIGFDDRSHAFTDEIGDFAHDHHRYKQSQICRAECGNGPGVVSISAVYGRIERPGVNDRCKWRRPNPL